MSIKHNEQLSKWSFNSSRQDNSEFEKSRDLDRTSISLFLLFTPFSLPLLPIFYHIDFHPDNMHLFITFSTQNAITSPLFTYLLTLFFSTKRSPKSRESSYASIKARPLVKSRDLQFLSSTSMFQIPRLQRQQTRSHESGIKKSGTFFPTCCF